MSIVAIIPARYQSHRLPGKPLAEIAGKPMIQHVCERALQAKTIDEVIVATDDERIVAAVRQFGVRAVMTPATLQSGTDRIAVVARDLAGAEIVVNVQGDEPLIAPRMIDEAVEVMRSGDARVGTLVKKIESSEDLFNPNVVKVVLANDGECLYFSRSPIPFGRDKEQSHWLTDSAYYKHIGLYAYRREFLMRYTELSQTPLEKSEKLEQLRVLEHGYKIKAAVTTYDSIAVDTESDLQDVRKLFSQLHG